MINKDLEGRVDRLLRGERRTDDLDRLYLGLRDRAFGRASVREIGDFVAHREQREKGPVTNRVRDIFISLESWVRGVEGQLPTIPELRKVAAANLRIATDTQLQTRVALRRQTASSVLEQGIRKLEKGIYPTPRERRVIDYLGSAFIWNQAFTAAEAGAELIQVLRQHRLLRAEGAADFEAAFPFLALYVVTLMHGSTVLMENEARAELFASRDNRQGFLEVKARLVVQGLSKPVIAPACIFWTELEAKRFCQPTLLADQGAWDHPLEIDPQGLLAPLI
jgi:hypothetical protein